MLALQIVLIAIGSYFVGNINASIIISRIKGGNIRTAGSGNPGTMNMVRTYGKALGVLTLVFDAFKASICCVVACFVFGQVPFAAENHWGIYIAGIAATTGHIFPMFMKFKGGKGIACIIGVNLVANPLVTLIVFIVGVTLIIFVKVGSLGSFFIIFAPLIYDAVILEGKDPAVSALIIAMVTLSLLAHRENIVRLFRGRENLTYIFKKKVKTKDEKPV